jgi:predicted RNA-binding Zn-ribbon protein involved in translation (DUF1610 family)
MTREEIIQKSAAYGRAVARIGYPCAIISGVAFVVWMTVRSQRTDVNLIFMAAVAVPIAVCGIVLSRLQPRLAPACPHCGRLLLKPRLQRHIFETGTCPNCKRKILDGNAGEQDAATSHE